MSRERTRAWEDTQGREQGTKAGTHGAHGVERGAVGERGRSQGHGHGHGMDTGAGSASQCAGDGGRDPRRRQGDKRVGAGKRPKGKAKGAVGPRGEKRRGAGAKGGGQSKGRGTGSEAPPQPDVQPVRCIPPGIQHMPADHTQHHHHHHAHLYNIDPDAGDIIPPQPPRPQHQPAPHAPRAEPLRMAAASAAGRRGAALAPQAQGPQGEPARGAEGTWPWDRDWGTVSDPLGGEALPMVVEVYAWLSWGCSGTTRGMRNRPFDAVLLRRDGGNREVPPGGWTVPEDKERVLRAVIRASWPDRGPTWPAFLEAGALRMRMPTTGSPGLCATPLPTGATAGGTRHRRSPSPRTSNDAGDGCALPTQAMSARGGGGGQRDAPPSGAGTPDPPPPIVRRGAGAHSFSNGGEDRGNEREGKPAAPQPANR